LNFLMSSKVRMIN